MSSSDITLLRQRFPAIRPVTLDDSGLAKHVRIVGPDAALRRRHVASMLMQQSTRGGGWIHFMRASDQEQLAQLQQQALAAGRGPDFYVVNLVQPLQGNTYSPLLGLNPRDAALNLAEHLFAQLTDSPLHKILQAQFQALAQVVYDYGFRRGKHPSVITVSQVLEAPLRFLTTIAKDRASAASLESLGMLSGGRVNVEKLASLWLALKPVLSAALFVRNLRAFDTPAAQVTLAHVLKNDQMLCVLLPDAEESLHPTAGHDVLALMMRDLVVTMRARAGDARGKGPAFLVTTSDLENLSEVLDPGASCTDTAFAPVIRLLCHARGYGVALVLGTSRSRDRARRDLSRFIEANSFTSIWHGDLAEHEVARGGRLMGFPKQLPPGAEPPGAARLATLRGDGALCYSGGKVSVGRVPLASLASTRPFQPYTHTLLLKLDELQLRETPQSDVLAPEVDLYLA